MVMMNRMFALGILLGNSIGFFLYASIISLAVSPDIPQIDVNGSTKAITDLKPNYGNKYPQSGLEIIDWLIQVWFIMSTAWSLWVLVNPFSS
jgi:hypothetical protein